MAVLAVFGGMRCLTVIHLCRATNHIDGILPKIIVPQKSSAYHES